MTSIKVEKIAGPYRLTEGPHWDHENQVLYFVNIHDKQILCYDPATKKVTQAYIRNGPVGVAIPVFGQKNTFIAGSGTDIVLINWDPRTDNLNPDIKLLSRVDVGKKDTRFNDGKIDPMGRFWAGTMGQIGSEIPPNQGTLYRFESNGTPKSMISPVTISNGLAWSHDHNTFYYIDSPTYKVFAYDYDKKTGDISNKRTIFDFPENGVPGFPDGMTIDKAGNLWIACYNGERVIQIDPKSGKLLRQVTIPAKEITSVAFGGKNFDILYVTSAKQFVSAEDEANQPLAGCVFAVYGLEETGVPMLSYKA